MCFPYLFRGALDTRATQITEEMKLSVAISLANIARQPVPQEVKDTYPNRTFEFGQDYVIPTPFDPRLIEVLPIAVAKAAIGEGIAKRNIDDMGKYKEELKARVKK